MNPSRTFHWTLWALWDQCWEMTGLRSSRLPSDKWWAPDHLSLPSAGRGERKCSRTYFIKKLSSITTTHPLCVYPSDDRRLKTAHSCWLTPQARHDWLDPTRHPTLTFPSDVQRTLYCTLLCTHLILSLSGLAIRLTWRFILKAKLQRILPWHLQTLPLGRRVSGMKR